ncbi:MAG TPA: Minf_1886 family protein [Verrucomicrobiae bacterium]|nr:Minf_1886 family protein [Verrucomicrobiae bacterium]
MQKFNFAESVDEIVREDGRYDKDAYYFVREGLDYTIKLLKKQSRGTGRHVSGQELLEGLRRFALEEFGPMSKTVLTYWGVKQCEDFGAIVFHMVDKGILGKTEQDTPEDFKGGYDFEEAFVKPYRPSLRHRRRRHAESTDGHGERYRSKVAGRSSDAKKLSGGTN